MTKPKKREQARNLRQQGLSYRQIQSELKVSLSSVSLWCRDIELTEEQQRIIDNNGLQYGDDNAGAKVNRETAYQERIVYQQAGREVAKQERFLHIVGCMLYWAEGAKHDRNRVNFANSDSVMVELFVRFLREELNVASDSIKFKIHCHTDDPQKIRQMERYWMDLLQLSESSLMNVQIKTGSNNRKNHLENGVCAIHVHSKELLMHILGAIQEYGNFTNEDWLY